MRPQVWLEMLSFLENQITIIRLVALIFPLSMNISSCRTYGTVLFLVTLLEARGLPKEVLLCLALKQFCKVCSLFIQYFNKLASH